MLMTAAVVLGLAVSDAVMAEAEPVERNRVLIVIDPGHTAGANDGAAVAGFSEGTWSYEYSLVEKQILEKFGFAVMITREEYENPGLYLRGQMAVINSGRYDAVVFMSNHSDACGADGNVNASGVSAITSAFLSEDNTELINNLLNAVAAEMNQKTGVTDVRDIQTRLNAKGEDYYGVLRGCVSGATSAAQAKNGPVQYAFILEHGFHTNYKECSYLNDKNNWISLATAKARVFVDFFDGKQKNTDDKTKADGENEQPVVNNESFWGQVAIVGDTLNLRNAPTSDNSSIITELVNGTRVKVLESRANQRYGDVWYKVDVSGTVGYVHSTWIAPDTVVGVASATCFTRVYADKGSTPLQMWPMLGPGNMVNVQAIEGGWCRISVARNYVGYVRTEDLKLQ